MEQETGEPLLADGQPVTAELEVTPTTASGTVDVTFTLDASQLAGKSIVIFEKLFQGDTEVAAHEDIEDEGQTVRSPSADWHHRHCGRPAHGLPSGQVTIVDKVEYSGLIPGQEYHVMGQVMLKESGNP